MVEIGRLNPSRSKCFIGKDAAFTCGIPAQYKIKWCYHWLLIKSFSIKIVYSMSKTHKYQISLYGMLLGALALLISLFHFNFYPLATKPPLEVSVAEKVSSIKNGILAGLKGQEPPVTEKRAIDIDNILNSATIGLAIVALVLAFIGGIRKENGWGVGGALFFGGGTLVFHAILFGAGLIFSIIILVAVLCFLFAFFPG